jgi:hypothetical protein
MKLPGLAGEALVLWVMCRYLGFRAFAVYAWLPAAILVSSYHGNTDCLYAALVLVAAIAFDKERYFLSGLLWSASLNVNLPLVLRASWVPSGGRFYVVRRDLRSV